MPKRLREDAGAPSGVQNAVGLFNRLNDADQKKVYAEVYEAGGFQELHPEPGASPDYNAFARAVEALSEDELQEFAELVTSSMGGRRRVRRKTSKKKAGRRRKTRRR